MSDYQIQTNSRRRTLSGRELRPGERFYSVLVEEAGKFVRKDYSHESWQGPPLGTFSFWAGKIPLAEESRSLRLDEDLLVDCFQRLEGQSEPSRIHFRYVVALLLMRRKRLKFEEARTEGDQELLQLRCVRTKTAYQVVNPRLTEEEMAAVQEEVFKVLGWE